MLNRKKTIISGVMAAMLAIGVASPAFAAETANPTSSTIYVDGQDIAFEAYNINGNNYFKLRDVAWALSGTSKQFNVTWDEEKQVINLVSGEEYPKTGALKIGDNIVKPATLNGAPIMVDGEYIDMMAYNINGNNFFKLRDLGEQFGFAVGWNGDANAVSISTTGKIEEVEQPKEEQKQETTNSIRWDLISTEYCDAEWISGTEFGLPEYIIAYETEAAYDNDTAYNYIDMRTGVLFEGNLTDRDWEIINSVPKTNQTFREGEKHDYPQIGDTIIKADGTKVVLQGALLSRYIPYSPPFITMTLGFAQGLDPYSGIVYPSGIVVKDGTVAWYDLKPFKKDPKTGEMRSDYDWHHLYSATAPDNLVSDTDGEIYREYWRWDADAFNPNTNRNSGNWEWLGHDEA